MERTKFGTKCDPLEYCRVLGKCALEPAESFFLVAKRYVNCRDHRCRDISLFPGLQELSENILRLRLAAHARVGDGKAAAREMGGFLDFGVKRDRFGEVPFFAIGGGKIRIEIKVIWIELQCPLTLTDCFVDLIVGKVGGRGNVAYDW